MSSKYNLPKLLFLVLAVLTGCKKFVQVPPPVTGLVSSTVYANNSTAANVLTSIYNNMVSGASGLSSGNRSVGYLSGLSSDELTNYSTNNSVYSSFYSDHLNAQTFNSFWPEIYKEIYVCNSALEGIAASKSLSPAVKQQLTGEAMFMRAFFYFYAVNLFGDVPLALTTNYAVNTGLNRAPQALVYQQIIMDLKAAQGQLSAAYLAGDAQTISTDRVRPTKWVSAALLARVYLYTKNWAGAEAEADTVINNTSMFNLNSNLNDVFLINSSEAIWQLQSVYPGINTWDAYFYVLTSLPGTGNYNVALSPNLISEFEPGDTRRSNWVGAFTADSIKYYYYPNKYKAYQNNPAAPVTEYTMVFRLAEQYLIRAEARAEQGNISGAKTDVDAIRLRAGLPATLATSKSALLSAILHERQVELFTEWGNRWLDLKRTGSADSVMSAVSVQKGSVWSPNWALYPIPQSEIVVNSRLTQNTGY